MELMSKLKKLFKNFKEKAIFLLSLDEPSLRKITKK